MPPAILTDGEEEPRVECQVRKARPTAVLLQSGEAALPFQKKSVSDFLTAEATKRATERQEAIDAQRANPNVTPNSSQTTSPEPTSVSEAHAPSTL